MAERDDMELMLGFDGEAELGNISARERVLLDALDQVGDAVTTHVELATDEADAKLDAMWASIERQITSPTASSEPDVVSPVRADEALNRAGWLSKWLGGVVGGWIDERSGHFMTGAVAAGVAVLLVVGLRPPQVRVQREIVHVPVAASSAGVVQTFAKSEPAVVEHLEVAGGSGTILSIPGDDDENPTTMIWLSRNETEGPI